MTSSTTKYEPLEDKIAKKVSYDAVKTAITSQPEAEISTDLPKQNWQAGLLDCSNLRITLCSVLCCECYASALSIRLRESCLVPWLPGGLATMRTKLRLDNNIQGSLLGDTFLSCVAMPCVLCQMGNELNEEQYPKVFCGLC